MEAFRIPCRSEWLERRGLLVERAVGWCDGARVPCRPKADAVAVMFFKDGRHFWFHLRREEFRRVFG